MTRDPTAFSGIDDILGIGGRGISIPIERAKPLIPIHNTRTSSMDSASKAREDSQHSIGGTSRIRANSSPSSNVDYNELLRSRELLERERELAARERSLLERERMNANRHRAVNSGIKGNAT